MPAALTTPMPEDTVAYTRQWLAASREKGVQCPVCDRRVKEYARPINRGQALAIAAMYLDSSTSWVNVRDLRTPIRNGVADKNNEISKLAHWGIIEQHPSIKRGGWWKVTALGEQWVRGEISIPKTAFIYQAELTGRGTEQVFIQDILNDDGEHSFDLRKIMSDIAGMPRSEDPYDSCNNFNTSTLARRASKIDTGIPADPDADALFAGITDGMERDTTAISHNSIYAGDTVAIARAWIMNNLEHGGYCPACSRIAIYKNYPMTDAMARLVIEMYRHHGQEFIHVRTFELNDKVVDRDNFVAKIAIRGLVEADTNRRSDGGKTGWYRVTDAGINWIFNHSKTPASIKSYNAFRDRGTVPSDKLVTVSQVFDTSTRWSYEELIAGFKEQKENDLFDL